MLYLTTRNSSEPFTSHHALRSSRAADGGFYVPVQLPCFSTEELEILRNKTFTQIVADILNCFFNARLSGWDVGFYIGKRPCLLKPLGHKIVHAQLWHNSDHSFGAVIRNLARHLYDADRPASNWTNIAIRIAVLFGLYGMYRQDVAEADSLIDVAVSADESLWIMAACYAREMGLPIDTVVFGAGEGSAVWELLHHGQTRLSGSSVTVDGAYVGGDHLERLIEARLGREEVGRYLDICRNRGTYTLSAEMLPRLRAGLFCGVVSDKRISSVLQNVYELSERQTASAYAALQDYRATTGETRSAWLISENIPSIR